MKFFYFLIFQISSVALCFGQEQKDFVTIDTSQLIVHYDYLIQTDSTRKESIQLNPMILAIGKQSSLFVAEGVFLSDFLIWEGKNGNEVLTVAGKYKRNLLSFFYIAKQYPDKKHITSLLSVPGVVILAEEKKELMQWKLKTEQDTIAGYLCNKATTHFAGRDYEAWYTLEIPISDGPYKFNGLPGLIVKIEDTKGEHSFTLSGLEKEKKVPIRFIYQKKRTVTASMKKYKQALDVWLKGGYISLTNSGLQLHDPSIKNRVVKRIKTYNNFIEKSEK